MIFLLIFFGILVGVLASFAGVGGGIIMVPLLLFLKKTHTQAVGTSFLAILIISAASLFFHNKLNNVIYPWGLYLGIGGILGTYIGSHLVMQVSQSTFQKLFGIFIIIMGIYLIFKK
jgi:uncharacterized membrane protein YfcA